MNNTNYGSDALQNNTTGINNTAIGAYSSFNNLDASNNTAVGSNSAFYTTSGSNNTSLGAGSLCNNTTGALNTAIGSSALEGSLPISSVGNANTAIGVQALYTNKGNQNTAIGAYSALGFTGGNYNTFLGANSSTLNNTSYNYSTAIGYGAKITNSNQIMLGGTGSGNIYPQVVAPGGITGPTGSFSYLSASQPISAPAGVIGGPGSFSQLSASQPISAPAGIIGGPGSFSQLSVSQQILLPSGITGGTGSFSNVVAGYPSGINIERSDGSISAMRIYSDFSNNLVFQNYSGNRAFLFESGDVVNSYNFKISDFSNNCIFCTHPNNFGSVGINNSSPSYHLDVSGNGRFTGYIIAPTGSFTNLYVTNQAQFLQDISVNSVTIGRGGGNQITDVVIGYQALSGLNSIGRNVAIGYQAETNNNNSSDNTSVGYQALNKNTTNGQNTAIGSQALLNNNTVGNSQTAVGYKSLYNNSGGTQNTSLGSNSGLNDIFGSYNTYLGTNTDNLNNYSYSTAIGYGAKINASNQIMLGGLNSGVYPQVVVPGGIIGATGSFNYLKVGTGDIGSTGTSIDVSGNVLFKSNLYNSSTNSIEAALGVISNYATNVNNVLNTNLGIIAQGYEAAIIATRGSLNPTTPINMFTLYPDALGNGNYNPIVKQGDHVLFTGMYPVANYNVTGGIVICPWSNIAGGTRMDPSGNFTFYNIITASGGISGTTANFSHQVTASGGISGTTATFSGQVTASGGISGTTANFSGQVTASGGISGTTANFSGQVTASVYNTPSDYRIKENIIPLNNNYTIDSLIPVTYKNKLTEKQDIGLIAHEVQEIYPFLVNGEKNGEELQSVNYTGLIPLLIKEIKDLKERVKILENK